MGVKVLFVYPNTYGMNMLPPAIALFSALLKERGHQVDLFDATYYQTDHGVDSDGTKAERLNVVPFSPGEKGIKMRTTDWRSDIQAKMESFGPDLIALSTTEDMWLLGVRILEEIEQYITKHKVPVIAGGVFPTFAPGLVIKHRLVDMVCVGEGENTMIDLCEHLDKGETYNNVTNLWIKHNDGKISKNSISKPFDINDTPIIDISLFEEQRLYRPMAGKWYKMMPVETIRGCPYKCTFCKSAILRKELAHIFPNTYFNETGNCLSESELIEFLKDADAAVVGMENINDQILSKVNRLKIISKYGVGLNNIDQESLKRRNITLAWKGGVNRRSVAELTLCFMLGLSRNIFQSGFKLKQTKWEKNGGSQLTGKTIGIIGCGNIGSDVIQIISPYNCELLVNDILDKDAFCKEYKAKQISLDNLVVESDIVSVHVPLTKLTSRMVNKSFLGKMKPTSFLINTSRGDVVDQSALHSALRKNEIAGAALDVFAEEPPTDEKFLSLPNLMVTPHIGGNAREAVEAMGRSAIDNLVSFFKNPKFLAG